MILPEECLCPENNAIVSTQFLVNAVCLALRRLQQATSACLNSNNNRVVDLLVERRSLIRSTLVCWIGQTIHSQWQRPNCRQNNNEPTTPFSRLDLFIRWGPTTKDVDLTAEKGSAHFLNVTFQ